MNVKKVMIFVLMIGMVVASVGAVSAQDGRGNPGDRVGERPIARGIINVVGAVTEATGLTAQEIAQSVRDGSTLAELVTANGGDVDAVTAGIIEDATLAIEEALAADRITSEQAERLLASLEETVNAAMNGDLRGLVQDRGDDRGNLGQRLLPNLLSTISEATGLDAQEIAEQVRNGSTLGEVITNSGGDVDAVITTMMAALTERVEAAVANGTMDEERGAELLANAEEAINTLMNADLSGRLGEGNGPRERLLQSMVRTVREAVSEATDLSQREIRQALRDGASLESLLTDAGVDVATFSAELISEFEARVAEAVANGNLDDDQAAQLIEVFTMRLEAMLTRTR